MEDVLRRVLKHFLDDFLDGLDGTIHYNISTVEVRDVKMKRDMWQDMLRTQNGLYQISECSIGSLQVQMESLGAFKIIADQISVDVSVVAENVAKALLPDLRPVKTHLHAMRPRGLDEALKQSTNTVHESIQNLSKFESRKFLSEHFSGSGFADYGEEREPSREEMELSRALIGFAEPCRSESQKDKFTKPRKSLLLNRPEPCRSDSRNGKLTKPRRSILLNLPEPSWPDCQQTGVSDKERRESLCESRGRPLADTTRPCGQTCVNHSIPECNELDVSCLVPAPVAECQAWNVLLDESTAPGREGTADPLHDYLYM